MAAKHARNLAGDTSPNGLNINFEQYTCFLSQWFGTLLGISAKQIPSAYGPHSGRSGGASAAANANVPIEKWDQHMRSSSRSSQLN
jgi:hypothetical protein